jgi:hypothetical protein
MTLLHGIAIITPRGERRLMDAKRPRNRMPFNARNESSKYVR